MLQNLRNMEVSYNHEVNHNMMLACVRFVYKSNS